MHTRSQQADAAADALFGRSRRAILTLLFGQSGHAFYLRQIAELTGLAVGSVQRELANLVSAGILKRRPEGSQVYFEANEQSPIYAELVGLVTKTSGVAGPLRAVLAPLAKKKMIIIAFVYGSIATGKQRPSSDVDLMIIGRVKLKELVPRLRRAQEQLGREINPTIYEPEEFSQRLAAGEHFVSRVIQTPRIMVIGSEDELEAVAR
jgi:predicted nucleotidyltransferase